MSQQTALFVFVLFILWLFMSDRKRGLTCSAGLWLPVIWIGILGSRPVSLWLGLGGGTEAADAADGSPLDRNVFLILFLAGLYVLRKRQVNWHSFISDNRWLFFFYLFFGLSAIWSDYSFITFKRWIKDLGNVVMVLVILTEANPVEAVRTTFARCAYLLLPLSVLFIKYFPDLGRAYDRWSGRPYYQGVNLSKNELGGMVFILTLFLVWDLIQIFNSETRNKCKVEIASRVILLFMSMWLLHMADSATSTACIMLGAFGLFLLNLPFIKRNLNNVLTYSVIGVVMLMLLSTFFDLSSNALGMLGRNSTLTGRTAIWKAVLEEQTNPLVGEGFYSFWLGPRVEKLSQRYAFRLNEAHNGYLDIYLNGGLTGVILLLAVLVSAGRSINKQLLIDPDWASIRLVIWLTIMIYNWTEASYCRISLLWFVLLVVIVQPPRPWRSAVQSNISGLDRSPQRGNKIGLGSANSYNKPHCFA